MARLGPKKRARINGNYLDTLKNFDVDDMQSLEQDLAYYERISIGFLLFGADPVNCKIILQKLLVLHRENHHYNGIIYDYTKINPVNWKHCLIEALTVIRAYKVLRKLGFNISELKLCFLPLVPEASLYIHPILKALYNICERLIPFESGQIIREVKRTISPLNQLDFSDESYFEIFILHWLSIGIINIGQWDRLNPTLSQNCNVDPIIQQLKIIDKYELRRMLENVVRSFTKAEPVNELQQQNNLMVHAQQQQQHQQLQIPNTQITSTSIPSAIPQQQQQKQHNVRDSAAVTSSSDGNFLNYNVSNVNGIDNVINERYWITKESAGFILIINQKSFYRDSNPHLFSIIAKEELSCRQGTDQDVEALKATFEPLGYIPDVRENLKSYEILDAVKQVTRKSIAFHSVIICILSHGIEGYVYGANSIPLAIQDIEDVIAKSHELLKKPKILFIQACQGSTMQKTITLSPYEYDSPKIVNGSGFYDMITAISTIPRFASVRHTENGTWFIQTICKKVKEYGDRLHIIDIMTIVMRDISYKRNENNECMVPRVINQLTKSLYFPQREVPATYQI